MATDAEDYFLKKLGDNDQDGFLWNRLGNLYFTGGRPELAAAAYEKSIGVDPSQMESYYSLSGLLVQVGEFERAAYHSRMMLVYARYYPHMPILELREMLAGGLQELYDIHVESDRKIPFIPTKEELEVMDSFKEVATGVEDKLIFVDLEVFPDDRESFYPLAEMYLGSRKAEIPAKERTLDQFLPGNRKQTSTTVRGHCSSQLGTDSRPIVISVRSEERAEKIYQLV